MKRQGSRPEWCQPVGGSRQLIGIRRLPRLPASITVSARKTRKSFAGRSLRARARISAAAVRPLL